MQTFLTKLQKITIQFESEKLKISNSRVLTEQKLHTKNYKKLDLKLPQNSRIVRNLESLTFSYQKDSEKKTAFTVSHTNTNEDFTYFQVETLKKFFRENKKFQSREKKEAIVTQIFYKDGSIYEGLLNKKGELHQYGFLRFPNGDEFIGEFRDNEVIKGEYYSVKLGLLYKGNFLNGKADGNGILQFGTKGRRFKLNGRFYKGKMNGKFDLEGLKENNFWKIFEGVEFKNSFLEQNKITWKDSEGVKEVYRPHESLFFEFVKMDDQKFCEESLKEIDDFESNQLIQKEKQHLILLGYEKDLEFIDSRVKELKQEYNKIENIQNQESKNLEETIKTDKILKITLKIENKKKLFEKNFSRQISNITHETETKWQTLNLLQGIYKGETNKFNQPHGMGIFLYNTQEKYEGNFKKGKRTGFGIFMNIEGVKYQGIWENDKLVKGKINFFERKEKDQFLRVVAQFCKEECPKIEEIKKNDDEKFDDFTIGYQFIGFLNHFNLVYGRKNEFLSFPKLDLGQNKSTYFGNFSQNLYHDRGILRTNNNLGYVGDFEFGKFSNFGVLKEDERFYKGEFEAGKKEGFGILYVKRKELIENENNFLNFSGKSEGKFMVKYIGNWKNGRFNEKGLLRLSGKLWLEGEFKNGKMHGGMKYIKIKNEEIEYEISFRAKNGIIAANILNGMPEDVLNSKNDEKITFLGDFILKDWEICKISTFFKIENFSVKFSGFIKSFKADSYNLITFFTKTNDYIEIYGFFKKGRLVKNHQIMYKLGEKEKHQFKDFQALKSYLEAKSSNEKIDEKLKNILISDYPNLDISLEKPLKIVIEPTQDLTHYSQKALIQSLFIKKRLVETELLDSFSSEMYQKFIKGLNLDHIFKHNPRKIFQILAELDFIDSIKIPLEFGTELHRKLFIDILIKFSFNFYITFDEESLLDVPRYSRIRNKHINKMVYTRAGCSIVENFLKNDNLKIIKECLKKNKNGYLIFDEIMLILSRCGFMDLRRVYKVSEFLVDVYEILLENERDFVVKNYPNFLKSKMEFSSRRVTLAKILIQILVYLDDEKYSRVLEVKSLRNTEKQLKKGNREIIDFRNSMINESIERLDYLHKHYVLNDFSRTEFSEFLYTSTDVMKLNLIVIDLVTKLKYQQSLNIEEKIKRGEKRNKILGIFKKKKSEGKMQFLLEEEFQEANLENRLVDWVRKETLNRKTGKEKMFYDSINSKNENFTQSNCLTFGIIFWEAYYKDLVSQMPIKGLEYFNSYLSNLGFSILFISSEYRRHFDHLNHGKSKSKQKVKEVELLQYIKSSLNLNLGKGFDQNLIDVNLLKSQINSYDMTYEFTRFVLRVYPGYNLLKEVRNNFGKSVNKSKMILTEYGIGNIDVFKVLKGIKIPEKVKENDFGKARSDFEIIDIYSVFMQKEMGFKSLFFKDFSEINLGVKKFVEMVEYFEKNKRKFSFDLSGYKNLMECLYQHEGRFSKKDENDGSESKDSVLRKPKISELNKIREGSEDMQLLSNQAFSLKSSTNPSQSNKSIFVNNHFIQGEAQKKIEFEKLSYHQRHDLLENYESLVRYKFYFVTYKRFLLMNTCHTFFKNKFLSLKIFNSLSSKKIIKLPKMFKQILYHSIVLDYLFSQKETLDSEDLRILEEIFYFLFSTLSEEKAARFTFDEESDDFFELNFKIDKKFFDDSILLICKHLTYSSKNLTAILEKIDEKVILKPRNFKDTKTKIYSLIKGEKNVLNIKRLIWTTIKIFTHDIKNLRPSLAETIRYSSVRNFEIEEFQALDENDDLENNFFEVLKEIFSDFAYYAQNKFSKGKKVELYNMMDDDQRVILVRDMLLDSGVVKHKGRSIFRFKKHCKQIYNDMMFWVVEKVNTDLNFQNIVIREIRFIENFNKRIYKFFEMASKLFDVKNRSKYVESPNISSKFYLMSFKQNVARFMKGICENTNFRGKELLMELEPKTLYIHNLLISLLELVQQPTNLKRNYRLQSVILKQLQEVCNGGYEDAQIYVTNIGFEHIFDIEYIMEIPEVDSPKLERDYNLVRFYLSVVEKRPKIPIERLRENPGLFLPLLRRVISKLMLVLLWEIEENEEMIRIENRKSNFFGRRTANGENFSQKMDNRKREMRKEFQKKNLKNLENFFKFSKKPEIDNSLSTLEKHRIYPYSNKAYLHYQYIYVLYKLYWTLKPSEDHLVPSGSTTLPTNPRSSKNRFSSKFKSEADLEIFKILENHFQIVEIKTQNGSVIQEIFPQSPLNRFIDSDFEKLFLTKIDPHNEDNQFYYIIDKISMTEEILKHRSHKKIDLFGYNLTMNWWYKTNMVINLFYSICLNLVFLYDADDFWYGKSAVFLFSTLIVLSSIFQVLIFLKFRFWDLKIMSMSEFNEGIKEKKKGYRVFDFLNFGEKKKFISLIFEFCGGFIFHLIISIMAVNFSTWFYTLHTLVSVNVFQASQFILKALGNNFRMFITTQFYLIVLLFSYSSVLKMYFLDMLVFDDIQVCRNSYACLLYNLSLGIRNSGGIGDVMTIPNYYQGYKKFIMREIFDVTYFMIINTIVFSIITGLIIDGFASVRLEEKEKSNFYLNFQGDFQNSICTVCLASKEEIQKENVSFLEHRNGIHNVKHYYEFLLYVKNKNRMSYNGVEEYVWECLEKRSLAFLPREED